MGRVGAGDRWDGWVRCKSTYGYCASVTRLLRFRHDYGYCASVTNQITLLRWDGWVHCKSTYGYCAASVTNQITLLVANQRFRHQPSASVTNASRYQPKDRFVPTKRLYPKDSLLRLLQQPANLRFSLREQPARATSQFVTALQQPANLRFSLREQPARATSQFGGDVPIWLSCRLLNWGDSASAGPSYGGPGLVRQKDTRCQKG